MLNFVVVFLLVPIGIQVCQLPICRFTTFLGGESQHFYYLFTGGIEHLIGMIRQMLHRYDEAKERLMYLQTTKRDEIVARIQEARSHGDLSENAEYDAARNEQAANEGEIAELDYVIKNAVIIAENKDTSYVHIGSKVRVYDEDMDEEEVYEITGSMESNAMENKISNESPVGKALMKRRVQDVVKVMAPEGEYKLIIKEIF